MAKGKELTPVIVARPVEWVATCERAGCFGYVRGMPGPWSERWYAGDFKGRGKMNIGQCDKCGRTYRVRKG